jgi:hypothetical protein
MNILLKLKLIVAVKKSNLPKEDKSQIIKILLTHNLEKSLPLILPILGVAEAIIKLFSP